MIPSVAITDFVAAWESCSLQAYQDPVGLWTIGYGHRIPPGGDQSPITQDEANLMLANDLTATMRGLSMYVSADWTQPQADALCSLAFNCGVQAIGNSHLLSLFNDGSTGLAAGEFLKWDYAGGVQLPGLLNRRKAEQDIFMFSDYSGKP